jgi:hypothetical protein
MQISTRVGVVQTSELAMARSFVVSLRPPFTGGSTADYPTTAALQGGGAAAAIDITQK